MIITRTIPIKDGFVQTKVPVEVECFKRCITLCAPLINVWGYKGHSYIPSDKRKCDYIKTGTHSHYLREFEFHEKTVELTFYINSTLEGSILRAILSNGDIDKISILPEYQIKEIVYENGFKKGIRVGRITALNFLIERPFDKETFYQQELDNIFR